MKKLFTLCTYIQISKLRAICGSAEQPLSALGGKALSVKVLCNFQWQADKIWFKETPEWKALEATKALTSWALT